MEVVPEPVKRIDSGLHVKFRRELKEWFFGGSPLQRWHNAVQHPVNVVLFLLEWLRIKFSFRRKNQYNNWQAGNEKTLRILRSKPQTSRYNGFLGYLIIYLHLYALNIGMFKAYSKDLRFPPNFSLAVSLPAPQLTGRLLEATFSQVKSRNC